MSHLNTKKSFEENKDKSAEKKTTSEREYDVPEERSWEQVEDSIATAIKTVENAMRATSSRTEHNLSIPLRRLYNRSKKLRLARGKVLREDQLDEENYITGRCMLGKFISGSC